MTNVANNLVSSQSNVSNVRNHLEDVDSIIKISRGPVFKRIFKASRLQACIAFTKLVQCVIDKNDRKSWENLLNFARLAIGNSKRGGKKKKKIQATILNKRIEAFMAGSPHQAPNSTMKREPPSLKKQVSAKMAQFDVQGAVRILSSNDSILQPSPETINKLKEKHPQKHPNSIDPPDPCDDFDNCFKTNRDNLLKALHSFKRGAAGGPDGLLPQHVIDMSVESLGEPASKFIDAMVTFMNIIVFPGKVPSFVRDIFHGANLIALSKPDGGVRPIAVGCTLRRLAAKIIMHDSRDFCEKEFRPHQVGVGTPKGGEGAVHALRAYLADKSSENKVVLKIDMENAFNTIRRDKILHLVKSKIPKIYNFIYQCYAEDSNYFIL